MPIREIPAFAVTSWQARRSPSCIVIPVLNEGERLHRTLERIAKIADSRPADVLVVDGGSTDESVTDSALVPRGVRARLIKTGPGRLGAQLRCAYAFALDEGYDTIVTIDGNNKDDPAAIPTIIQRIRAGADLVQASRFLPGGKEENTPMIRLLGIRLIHAPLLSLAAGVRFTDTTQGFRGYSRRLLIDERVQPFRDVFRGYELLPYLSYRAGNLGFSCTEVPSTRTYPAGPPPTKIVGLRGNLEVARALLMACAGQFNPAKA
jgi:glycosyltransferase involved in cell wall biosynthesis